MSPVSFTVWNPESKKFVRIGFLPCQITVALLIHPSSIVRRILMVKDIRIQLAGTIFQTKSIFFGTSCSGSAHCLFTGYFQTAMSSKFSYSMRRPSLSKAICLSGSSELLSIRCIYSGEYSDLLICRGLFPELSYVPGWEADGLSNRVEGRIGSPPLPLHRTYGSRIRRYIV